MEQHLILIIIGAIIGFLSGLFGVGGSSIATPLLRLVDVSRMVALASPLPVTIPTAVIGGVIYWRRGYVDLNAVLWTVAGGIPSVILGAYLTAEVPGRILMALTGFFVIIVGAKLLLDLKKEEIHDSLDNKLRNNKWLFILTGIITGLFSGFLANGGGFLLLPAYLLVFRFSPREAAATSLVAVSLLALPGTLVHYLLGHIDYRVVALLAVGVIPSTYLGSHMGLKLSKNKSRLIFGIFLLSFGLFFFIRTLYRAELYGWFK